MAKSLMGLSMALLAVGVSPVRATDTIDLPRVFVRMTNYATVPGHLLRPAELEITRVFAAAGVEVVSKEGEPAAKTLDILLPR